MTNSTDGANSPQEEKKAAEKAGGGFFAGLGLVIANTIFVLAMSDWLQTFFTGLPAAMLDRTLVVVVFAFVAGMQAAPKGRSGLIRLVVGSFLFSLSLIFTLLLAGLAMSLLLPARIQETYLDELQWFGLIPVLLLSFPMVPALARIGLMPGFRWSAEGPLREAAADEGGAAAAHPGWFPPGAGGRLLAISAAGGIAFASYHLVERLALAWPESFLSHMEPEFAVFAILGGGMIGLFYRPERGWTMLLALTLAGSAAMTSILLAFGFVLFLLWPDISPSLFGLFPGVALLLLFLLVADRVLRRDSENTSRDADCTTTRGEP